MQGQCSSRMEGLRRIWGCLRVALHTFASSFREQGYRHCSRYPKVHPWLRHQVDFDSLGLKMEAVRASSGRIARAKMSEVATSFQLMFTLTLTLGTSIVLGTLKPYRQRQAGFPEFSSRLAPFHSCSTIFKPGWKQLRQETGEWV